MLASKDHKERIFSRNFIFVTLAMFFVSNVMYGLNTTIAEYAVSYGATAGLAGIVTGIYTIGGLCTRLGVGGAMERFGWKRLTMTALTVHFIACCLYFTAWNLPSLIIIRFIHGLGFGVSASGIATIGMSLIPRSRYGEGAGYFMLAPALAMAVGPYVSGRLMDAYGGTGGFLMSATAAMLILVFMGLTDIRGIDPGPQERKRDEKKTVHGLNSMIEVKALPISMCIFLFALSYSGIMSFIREFGRTEHIDVAFFFIIYAVILLISRPIAGKIQDIWGDNTVVYPAIFMQAAGLVLMAWKPCLLTVILAAVGCALGYGTLNSCIQAIAAKLAPRDRLSYSVTTFWICCDGGMGLGPMLLGYLVSLAGYRWMYFASAIIALAALPLYFMSWGRWQAKG